MNYALGHSFNMEDMFYNFPNKKLKMSCEECLKLTGDAHRENLMKKIFKASLKLVLNDVIDNNVSFLLPTGSKRAEIKMYAIEGDDFTKARKNGKFREIDFLKSYFTGYDMGLFMYGTGRTREKRIYLDSKIKAKLTEHVNNGKSY